MYEVTQAEYEPLMGSNPSRFAKTGSYPEFVEKVQDLDTSSHPVENVAWNDAVEFCESLNRREKHSSCYRRSEGTVQIVAGDGYRLPTNAEWEFACRGGTTTKYWFGNDEEKLGEVAWFANNADGRTHPVGELKPNPFLLSDMSGNVWEWVQDRWTQNYYSQFVNEPAVDPPGPSSDSAQFVIRGGHCFDPPLSCRSSNRDANVPPDHFGIGLRLSLSVEAVRASLNIDDVPNP
jgi:formylglycine-generating enzyme required for sulfatase activity